jgi:hypothetical protein
VIDQRSPRRVKDFRRVTPVTCDRASDGDTLYLMPSAKLDQLVQRIRINETVDTVS